MPKLKAIGTPSKNADADDADEEDQQVGIAEVVERRLQRPAAPSADDGTAAEHDGEIAPAGAGEQLAQRHVDQQRQGDKLAVDLPGARDLQRRRQDRLLLGA